MISMAISRNTSPVNKTPAVLPPPGMAASFLLLRLRLRSMAATVRAVSPSTPLNTVER